MIVSTSMLIGASNSVFAQDDIQNDVVENSQIQEESIESVAPETETEELIEIEEENSTDDVESIEGDITSNQSESVSNENDEFIDDVEEEPDIVKEDDVDVDIVAMSASSGDYQYSIGSGYIYINSSGEITSSWLLSGNVVIPSRINGITVKSIGYLAMAYDTSITGITLPDTLTSIDKSAFAGDSLIETITIPSGVTSIGETAFRGCSNLKSVYLSKNLETIGDNAFRRCSSLTTISFGNNLKTIGQHAFDECSSLKNITIPEGVTSIGDGVFADCTALEKITFPKSLKTLGTSLTFYRCSSLTTVYCYKGTPADNSSLYSYGNNTKIVYFDNSTSTVQPASFKVAGIMGGRNVTFNCATSGAKIYYTTENRSTLKLTDTCVTPGTTVTFNAYYGTIYARAYYNGKWSNVSRLVLKIPTVNTPTITRNGTKVKIKTTTPSALVYYTTNGTTPSATNYAGKFWCSHDVVIPSGKTIKAIAVRSCFSDSAIATKTN